jgi:hypothetical protein
MRPDMRIAIPLYDQVSSEQHEFCAVSNGHLCRFESQSHHTAQDSSDCGRIPTATCSPWSCSSRSSRRNPTVLIWSIPTISRSATGTGREESRNPTVLIWSIPTECEDSARPRLARKVAIPPSSFNPHGQVDHRPPGKCPSGRNPTVLIWSIPTAHGAAQRVPGLSEVAIPPSSSGQFPRPVLLHRIRRCRPGQVAIPPSHGLGNGEGGASRPRAWEVAIPPSSSGQFPR